jgi:hypothetical protein
MSSRVPYARDHLADDYPDRFITLINFLMYQVAWFACVLGTASDRPMLGVAIASAVVAWHLSVAVRPMAELKLIVMTGLIGVTWESFLVALDWVRYEGGHLAGLAPTWIIALWLAFATTLNRSLNWLKGRTFLATGLGSLAGALAWWAGERMGALHLSKGEFSLVVIGAGWALLMPLLSTLAAWVDETATTNTQRR